MTENIETNNQKKYELADGSTLSYNDRDYKSGDDISDVDADYLEVLAMAGIVHVSEQDNCKDTEDKKES